MYFSEQSAKETFKKDSTEKKVNDFGKGSLALFAMAKREIFLSISNLIIFRNVGLKKYNYSRKEYAFCLHSAPSPQLPHPSAAPTLRPRGSESIATPVMYLDEL